MTPWTHHPRLASFVHSASDEQSAWRGCLREVLSASAAVAATEVLPLVAFVAQDNWCRSVERWRRNVWASLERHLADEAEVALPTVTASWPPATGKPRHARKIDWVEPWLRDSLRELRDFSNALGVRRNLTAAPPLPGRFDELRASGLVDEAIIDDAAKEMMRSSTPKQLADAIGAAKELTEATLRAGLARLSVAWDKDEGVQQLMRKWRDAVRVVAAPDATAQDSLDKAQAALGNVVAFLAEWRNEYGRGHGRSKYPRDLRARHARLAVDAAETAIRFIVMTMDDAGRLPPR